MKKLVGIAAMGLLVAASFTSCKKCGTCYVEIDGSEWAGTRTTEVCGSDWDTLQEAADETTKLYEAFGDDVKYVCEES